jgi:3-dehydroshikimate dehydratase
MSGRAIIRPGLCSVTFRQFDGDGIVRLAASAGIEAIEWGMDVHLPPGDLAKARRLRAICGDAGIVTPTVGSYVRSNDDDPAEFDAVLETCLELGARRIRIWAGKSGSAETDAGSRAEIVSRIRGYCDRASVEGCTIGLEYHRNTLTDTLESTIALLHEVDHPALVTYWQPRAAGPVKPAIAELHALADWLGDLHVFHWQDYNNRYPLADGRAYWSAVFDAAATIRPTIGERCGFLEFVKSDDPDQFRRDAQDLKAMLADLVASE